MSTKAVRIAITLQNLDPFVAHSKCDKYGRLIDGKVSNKPNTQKTEEIKISEAIVEIPVEEITKKEIRNALIETKPNKPAIELEQTVDIAVSFNEEIKKDDSQIADVKNRKNIVKKKSLV